MIWYCGQPCESDNVAPIENLDIAQDVVTNLTKDETPDWFESQTSETVRKRYNFRV